MDHKNKRNFQKRIDKRTFPLVFSDFRSEAIDTFFHIESSPSFVAIHDIENKVHDPQHIVHPDETIHHSWKRRPVNFL